MIKLGMFISDRYEIIENVGTGGMADVYKAKCHRLNRYVAIKILKQEYSSDTKFVSKFRAEAQSVAGLSHPNIVSVFDVGEDDGLYYIVMELVEGITLKKYIEKKTKLEVKEALGIAIQIAQGMEAAHNHNIIHRDIKPQNIIISKEGKVKVTDFGIAKAASSNTITSNAMGSVHYISPEQARGGFSDAKSDIYSLGITMYEMLHGSVPFSGDNTVAVALAHIQEEAPPLSALNSAIPSSVNKIVLKCMQKKQELRYLDVSSLIVDLKRAISDPDGDFVKITPIIVDSSPTIHISDEDMDNIRNASKTVMVTNDTPNEADLDSEDLEDIDEKGSDIDPKLEKALVIGSIAVAAVLCLIVFFTVGKLLGFWGGGAKGPETTKTPEVSASPNVSSTPMNQNTTEPDDMADMPDLVNETKENAINELERLNLTYNLLEESSDIIEAGNVIRTNPQYGAEITSGSEVELVISTGHETFKIPDVTKDSLTEAQTKLLDLNFRVKLVPESSSTVEIEKIIRTEPKAGTEAVRGDQVTIFYSKGKEVEFIKVPNLLNKSKKDAVKDLENAGLKKGTITNNYSDKYEAGLVMAQSQPKNTEVQKGTKIDFTVSLGKKVATPTPTPTYQYIGSVSINYNPFDYESEPSATIMLVLTQDGKSKKIMEEVMNYYSFSPALVLDNVEGSSESEGKIEMFKNGAQVGSVYNISFKKVMQ